MFSFSNTIDKLIIYLLVTYSIDSNDIYNILFKNFVHLVDDLEKIQRNAQLIKDITASPIEKRNARLRNFEILTKHGVEPPVNFFELPSLFSIASHTAKKRISHEQVPWYQFWKSIPDYENEFLKLPLNIKEKIEIQPEKELKPYYDPELPQIFADICEIKNKNDLKHKAKNGFYLLGIVSKCGPSTLVEELLDFGADISQGASILPSDPILRLISVPIIFTPLNLACKACNYSSAKILINRGGVLSDDYTTNFDSLLSYPVYYLNVELVSLLLENKVDPNTHAPLHSIVERCKDSDLEKATQIIELFVSHGVSFDNKKYNHNKYGPKHTTLYHDLFNKGNWNLSSDSRRLLATFLLHCHLFYQMIRIDLETDSNIFFKKAGTALGWNKDYEKLDIFVLYARNKEISSEQRILLDKNITFLKEFYKPNCTENSEKSKYNLSA